MDGNGQDVRSFFCNDRQSQDVTRRNWAGVFTPLVN
jgi:hypothetical protein